MLEQYLRIKEENPGALLFYRMGDFYELFFEDAEVAARDLQIALTTRNPKAENPVPMCGIPHHARDNYLPKLLEMGHSVAICDQVEDPKQAKGLVKREVTRILTPGTVVEDSSLTAKDHNYLAALFYDSKKNAGGLAWVDFSTGEWTGIQAKREEELWQWMQKVNPSEILLPREHYVPKRFADMEPKVHYQPIPSFFDLSGSVRRLCEAQDVADLKALELADKPQLTQACGALLSYLRLTQKRDLKHLSPFKPLHLGKHLILDEVTERNLEIFRRLDGGRGRGTLWSVLDRTLTPMGGRLLAERLQRPWKDLAPIRKSQEAVSFFVKHEDMREELRDELDKVYDLERLSTRIFLNRATPKDFLALRNSLEVLPDIAACLDRSIQETDEAPRALEQLFKGWDSLADWAELLIKALADNPPHQITEGGLFRYGYNPDLDELLELTEHGEARLQDLLEAEKKESGIEKIKLGFNKVFGYFLEVPKSLAEKVPYHFTRKQTLVNSERYITPDLKELEGKLLSASDKRKELEYTLFNELRQRIAESRHRFIDMAGRLAALDFWQGLAEAAVQSDWTCPELHDGLELDIVAGRHPVVEAVQGSANYIPNDVHLDEHKRLLLITGPNMAGKSTVLRQAAIITIMAQIGSFVPARKAKIGLADRIFSRVGASDNLAQGQSTFMVEMMETARILRQANSRSLVILDEIGRGTSTFDGLALAWAVVEELCARGKGGVRTLFATHYHELTVLETTLPQVSNYNIAVKEYKGDIVFLRRLVPGPSDRSYGIEVAKLAGVPRPVVSRAKEILKDLEQRAKKNGKNQPVSAPATQSVLLPGFMNKADEPILTEDQPPVLSPEMEQLVGELDALDINRLSPIEALNILHKWKSMDLKKDTLS
ncbi:DNA mismatch repair protein MutS [Desulfobaculum bizertense]|uniref:DNA mismatch repair protein MutS n=1 Tax=Desulfobaculum bizertense TaxID=376490 RepID=UPI001F2AA284|nr:DNA mismatch repair protein MutS [Desulfobaculum bizertense]UIJ39437.1 DNA mismatch repair protein MutS [Desulfobaculum bizertense]